MKKNNQKFSVFMSVFLGVLIAATALFASCSSNATTENNINAVSENYSVVSIAELGKGAKQFTFEVVTKDENASVFTINTDEETVGEALKNLKLIDGEESSIGLYVKTVNGITADYNNDGTYWAFYIDGQYASSGVDTTTVTSGSTYKFAIE